MAIVDGNIRCHRCGELKPLSEYQPSVVKVGCGACRACKQEAKREYNRRNPAKANAARKAHRHRNIEHHRAGQRARYKNNREAYRNYNLSRYGITTAIYDAMLRTQGGCCACCGAKANGNGKRLFVDHDHESNAIRGILCQKCNAGIGALGDTIEGVRRALAYLERAQQQSPMRSPSIRINLLGAN